MKKLFKLSEQSGLLNDINKFFHGEHEKGYDKDALYSLKLEKYYFIRSSDQNRYLFKMYREIKLFIWTELQEEFTVEELHEFFKSKFSPVSKLTIDGDSVTFYLSSSDMDSKQFTDFIENIKRYASIKWGLYIE